MYLNRIEPDYNNNSITGLIRKGITGTESYIDELKSDKESNGFKAATIGTIGYNQFNSSPFFFHLVQPDEQSKGILFIAQSYKQYGFKELFQEAFKEFTKSINQEFTSFIYSKYLSLRCLMNSLTKAHLKH